MTGKAVSTYDAVVAGRGTGFGEHCRAHPSDLRSIGRAVDDQVRIVRSEDDVALYTVKRATPVPARVAMSRAGTRRLRGVGEFGAVVSARVVHPNHTDEDARKAGELVERLVAGRARRIAVAAPHGGEIESHTDEQAARLRSSLRSFGSWAWMCKGWGRRGGAGAFSRWHITSTDLSPRSFPLLATMLRAPFEHAVSFHGFDETKFPGADVRIGGRAAPKLRGKVRDAIHERVSATGLTVVVAGGDDPFNAMDPDNIVNRLSPVSGGLQIEQSGPARDLMASEIADAVASVYRVLLF